MIIWRLTKVKTKPEAFNGMGAFRYGGRWNSKNVKMVYCAGSISLAVLENLVDADSDLLPKLYLYQVDIPDALLSRNTFKGTLSDRLQTVSHGDSWAQSTLSVGLEVPSVIVPQELNVILNPDHPEFSKIQITEMGIFDLDKRLIE